MLNRRTDINGLEWYIIERIASGHSLRMISESLQIERTTLSKKLKERGIRIPTREEAAKNTWKNHKHPHLGLTGEASYAFGKKMKEETKEKLRIANTGPNNYHWSGGRKKHSQGYILVHAPNHPNADRGGFVLEHRLVMENAIGRYLDKSEIVHHANENKSDNRIENLFLTTMSEHARHHMEKRKANKYGS